MTIVSNIQNLGLISKNKPLVLKFIDSPVSGGFPSPAQDFAESEFDLNDLIKSPNATFLMRINGDSMEKTIANNSLLLVDCKETPRHNDIVVATINNDFTCKRFIRKNHELYLMADNPQYEPIRFNDGDELKIFGVVISHVVEHRKCLP